MKIQFPEIDWNKPRSDSLLQVAENPNYSSSPSGTFHHTIDPNPPRFQLVGKGTFHEVYDHDTGEFIGIEEDMEFVRVHSDDPRYPTAPFEISIVTIPLWFTSPTSPAQPDEIVRSSGA